MAIGGHDDGPTSRSGSGPHSASPRSDAFRTPGDLVRKLQAGDYEGAARALDVSTDSSNELIRALAELAHDLAHDRKGRETRLAALMDGGTQLTVGVPCQPRAVARPRFGRGSPDERGPCGSGRAPRPPPETRLRHRLCMTSRPRDLPGPPSQLVPAAASSPAELRAAIRHRHALSGGDDHTAYRARSYREQRQNGAACPRRPPPSALHASSGAWPGCPGTYSARHPQHPRRPGPPYSRH